MQASRFITACAGAAVLLGAAAAAVTAQTTTAPTTVPMAGPTATAAPVMMTPAPMVMTMVPMPVGTLAIDARALRARRTATGFTLGGQALVKDACQAARFDIFRGTVFPAQFNATQFRRPGTMGMMCVQRLTWVTVTPRQVRAWTGQKSVTVHTQKRPAIVVPIR